MAADQTVPVCPPGACPPCAPSEGEREVHNGAADQYLIPERAVRESVKWYLMNKYRTVLVERLTREDLEELQFCLRWQQDKKDPGNPEYLHRFIEKLRGYLHDEVLRQEIIGIETLVTLMKPDDLGRLSPRKGSAAGDEGLSSLPPG